MTGRGKAKAPSAASEPEASPAIGDKPDGFVGPSTDPATNLLLANLALTGGMELVRRGLEHGLLGKGYAPGKARSLLKDRSLTQTLAGAALTRLATRSVPGAILVGGGLLAKTLYDRRRRKVEDETTNDPTGAKDPQDP